MPRPLSRFFPKPVARAVVLFAAALLAACAGGAREGQPRGGGAAIATVNGRAIPASVYEMYLKNAREELRAYEGSEEGRRKIELLREGIVSELIDRELIRQEAERRNLRPEPERVAEEERRAVEQLGGEEKFAAYLAEHKLAREEFMETARSPLFAELLRRELGKDLKVSDEDVASYYESRRADAAFQLPERVTASHILVAARPNLIERQLREERGLEGVELQSAVRAEVEARRARAEGLRLKLHKPVGLAGGPDFAALAREFSDDAGTRGAGGALGTFARGSHAKAFDDAAFALKAGEVSRVVQTDFGFHVIKVTAREPARSLTLEEAAPEIRRRLLAAREAETLAAWLKEARRAARIRVAESARVGALREFAAL